MTSKSGPTSIRPCSRPSSSWTVGWLLICAASRPPISSTSTSAPWLSTSSPWSSLRERIPPSPLWPCPLTLCASSSSSRFGCEFCWRNSQAPKSLLYVWPQHLNLLLQISCYFCCNFLGLLWNKDIQQDSFNSQICHSNGQLLFFYIYTLILVIYCWFKLVVSCVKLQFLLQPRNWKCVGYLYRWAEIAEWMNTSWCPWTILDQSKTMVLAYTTASTMTPELSSKWGTIIMTQSIQSWFRSVFVHTLYYIYFRASKSCFN